MKIAITRDQQSSEKVPQVSLSPEEVVMLTKGDAVKAHGIIVKQTDAPVSALSKIRPDASGALMIKVDDDRLALLEKGGSFSLEVEGPALKDETAAPREGKLPERQPPNEVVEIAKEQDAKVKAEEERLSKHKAFFQKDMLKF